jgi:AcrR family transcriptional regulator
LSRITQIIKAETKQCIIEEAQKLFIEQGFEKTKTKTIAKNCNIAEGTLFNYFKSKDELLIAVFETMAEPDENQNEQASYQPLNYFIELALFPVRKMRKFPKNILTDLMLITLKFAKKKPKLFNKLVEMDYKYIDQMTKKLVQVFHFNDDTLSAKEFAEMIYSVVATEFIIYLYDEAATYDALEVKAIKKLNLLFKPYLQGGEKCD